MMYVWGENKFTGYTSYLNIPITKEEASKSLFYAYYTTSTSAFLSNEAWLPVPGVNNAGSANYEAIGIITVDYITYLGTWKYDISLYSFPARTSLTTEVTWDSFRLVVVPIPDTNIFPKSAPAVDFNDYAAVAKYYGLPQ